MNILPILLLVGAVVAGAQDAIETRVLSRPSNCPFTSEMGDVVGITYVVRANSPRGEIIHRNHEFEEESFTIGGEDDFGLGNALLGMCVGEIRDLKVPRSMILSFTVANLDFGAAHFTVTLQELAKMNAARMHHTLQFQHGI